MAFPFRRSSGFSRKEDGAPVSSFTSPMQRLWEVQVLLCSLSPLVREALFLWLLAPTNLHRWPPPTTFQQQRAPISQEEVGDDLLANSVMLLREELSAIRQTLDFPPEAMSGLTRNGLLTMHAVRLRQVEGWLWPVQAASLIQQMIA